MQIAPPLFYRVHPPLGFILVHCQPLDRCDGRGQSSQPGFSLLRPRVAWQRRFPLCWRMGPAPRWDGAWARPPVRACVRVCVRGGAVNNIGNSARALERERDIYRYLTRSLTLSLPLWSRCVRACVGRTKRKLGNSPRARDVSNVPFSFSLSPTLSLSLSDSHSLSVNLSLSLTLCLSPSLSLSLSLSLTQAPSHEPPPEHPPKAPYWASTGHPPPSGSLSGAIVLGALWGTLGH
jgi:hypothetical protein